MGHSIWKKTYRSPFRAIESEKMAHWLELRNELEKRMTDEETLRMFREFVQLSLDLSEDEAEECFWKGTALAISVVRQSDKEREKEGDEEIDEEIDEESSEKSSEKSEEESSEEATKG